MQLKNYPKTNISCLKIGEQVGLTKAQVLAIIKTHGFPDRKRGENYINMVFGNLTVKSFDYQGERSCERFFNCECVCGSVNSFLIYDLKNGFKTSCGCIIKHQDNGRFKTREELKTAALSLATDVFLSAIEISEKLGVENSKVVSRILQRNGAAPRQLRPVIKDGSKHNMLTVLRFSHRDRRSQSFHHCKCDCGNELVANSYLIRAGIVVNCGCITQQGTHKGTGTTEYKSWTHMRERCNNPRCHDYLDYGGRGISYSSEWEDFERFINDIGLKPSTEHSLDRVDVNGNYSKENCRWASKEDQARNKRNSMMIQLPHGDWCSLHKAAELLNVTPKTIKYHNPNTFKRMEEIISIEKIIYVGDVTFDMVQHLFIGDPSRKKIKSGLYTNKTPIQMTRNSWAQMVARCSNPDFIDYRKYGAKGITFQQDWVDFEKFIEDMGIRPSEYHSLDRVDFTKSYTKDNCRWLLKTDQNRNKSNKKMFLRDDGVWDFIENLPDDFGLSQRQFARKHPERISHLGKLLTQGIEKVVRI